MKIKDYKNMQRQGFDSCFTGQARYQYRTNSNAASVNKTFFVFFKLMKCKNILEKVEPFDYSLLQQPTYVEGQ